MPDRCSENCAGLTYPAGTGGFVADERELRKEKSVGRQVSTGAAVVFCLLGACAGGLVVPGRLADGTVVPRGADYQPPLPIGGIPHVPYPESLRKARIEGRFAADVMVSSEGEVLEVRVVHAFFEDLDDWIIAKLREQRFEPAVLDGQPVAAMFHAIYEFSLR